MATKEAFGNYGNKGTIIVKNPIPAKQGGIIEIQELDENDPLFRSTDAAMASDGLTHVAFIVTSELEADEEAFFDFAYDHCSETFFAFNIRPVD